MRRALALYEKTGDTGGTAEALTNLSALEARREDFRSAEKHAKKALVLLQEARRSGRDHRSAAPAPERIRNGGSVWRAEGYLDDALALAKKWGDAKRAGDVHVELAALADRREKSREALRHEREAINCFERAAEVETAAYRSLGLGDRLFRQQDLEGAAASYDRARALYGRPGERLGVASALHQSGLIDVRGQEWETNVGMRDSPVGQRLISALRP